MKTKFLALLLALVAVFSVTSCAKGGALDIDDAEVELGEAGYRVRRSAAENLDVGIEAQLTARSEDGEDYVYIMVFKDAKYAKIYYKTVKHNSDASIESTELEIKGIEHILDKYGDELDQKDRDYYREELKELKDSLKEAKEMYCYGIKGKTVWYGTTDAIEDARG